MAIVILDPAQVQPFLATGAFPARWGKSTCAERVLPPGGGVTCESEDRLESLFPILNPTKKKKKKKNTWSDCIENSRLGAQQREKLVELRKRLCPFAFYVLGESARVNRVTAKYKMSFVNVF